MKIKRVVSVCAAASVLLGSLNLVSFAADEVSATALGSVINISGTAEGVKGSAAVMIAKKTDGEIAYFGDVKLADDGKYSISFPSKDINIADYEVRIKSGDTVKTSDITNAEQQLAVSFKKLKNSDTMTAAGIAVSIGNLYKTDLTDYKLIAAAYDADGKLKDVIYEDASLGMTGGKLDITSDIAKVNCYLWNKMLPQSDEESETTAAFGAAAKKLITSVNCWGDSLTAGANGDGTTYPGTIASLTGSGVTVTNYGVGGEKTREIAGRMGAVPFKLSADATIPAGTTTAVRIQFNGGEILKQGGNDKYSIDGVTGTLAAVKDQPTLYDFTRDTAGAEKTVKKGTEVLPVGINLAGVNIIWTGANDRANLKNDFEGTKSYIFDAQGKMIDKIKAESGEYVVVGITAGDAAAEFVPAVRELEEYQAAKYGERFLNLRSILTDEKTYAKYNVSITETDREMMASGRIPSTILSSDKLHFNAVGYEMIGKIIYSKLMALGLTM